MVSSRLKNFPAHKALSIFFTAGFPRRDDVVAIAERLEAAGVDLIEIGFPFSDPVADGPTIQNSNQRAIANGMSLRVLFEQLATLREHVSIPALLMGYMNPVERYGVERFLNDAARCGIDGLILPDMPFDEYQSRYRALFQGAGIAPVFLVTPRTPEARIREFNREGPAFLYLVSSDAVTGGALTVSSDRAEFFERVRAMGLSSRLLVGFGVSDRSSFLTVTTHTDGAIIGSAFLKAIDGLPALPNNPMRTDLDSGGEVRSFIERLRPSV